MSVRLCLLAFSQTYNRRKEVMREGAKPKCEAALLTAGIRPGGQAGRRAREIRKEENQWERESLRVETHHIYQPMKKEGIPWKRESLHAGTFYVCRR